MGIDAVSGKERWVGLLLASVLSLGLPACDDAAEGCLDYRALSVDLYAEQACDDCCTYPRLNLRQVPGRDVGGVTRAITRDTLLVRAGGDTTRLTALVYFLHDLELEFDDGRVYPLTDTFSFRQNLSDPLVLQERSLLRATPLRSASLTTGQLLEEGTVVALRAKFGLPSEYVPGRPAAQTNALPLALGQDSLLFDARIGQLGGYRSAYLRTLDLDGRRDSSWVVGGASVPQRYVLPTPTLLERSRNLNLTLLLPVTPLVDLPGGPVDATAFAAAFLAEARVISATTAR